MTLAVLIAGLVAGIASIPHCAAMCGPLAAFACAKGPARAALPRWQAGRLLAYAAVGALAGGGGTLLVGGGASRWAPALVSWSCAVALALAAARLWPWRARPPSTLVSLGRRPLAASVAPRALSALAGSPGLFGAATALLPCGALAAAVLLAASTASTGGGALSMAAFAAGSAPGLVGFGWLAAALGRVRVAPVAARILALVLVLGALVQVVRPLPALLDDRPRCMACPE